MASDLVNEAQRRARVDTGQMRDSIRIAEESEARTIVRCGTPQVYWGIFNEYGTIKMSAQPFMRPAAAIVGAKAASGTYTGGFEDELLR